MSEGRRGQGGGALRSGTRERPPVVLLVDPSAEQRAEYAQCLTREGFLVVQAGDGREAVEKARALVPDVIVMDPWLPALDGFATVRVLGTYEATSGIPVLALTTHRSLVDIDRLGFEDLLLKPCSPEDLVARVRAAVQRRAKSGRSATRR